MMDCGHLRLLMHHLNTPVLAHKAARRLLQQIQDHEEEQRTDVERVPGIHPSALASCARQAWMELAGAPRFREQVPEPVRRAGRVGSVIHSLYQRDFQRVARTGVFTYAKEVSLPEEHPDCRRLMLRGRADGLIEFESKRLGQEIKSASDGVWKQLSTNPTESHLLQAAVYQHCLDLDGMWFIYVNRKTFADRHFVLKIPDNYWLAMRKRASIVLDHKIMDTAPPGTDDMGSCRMCNFNHVCPEPRDRAVDEEEVWRLANMRTMASED